MNSCLQPIGLVKEAAEVGALRWGQFTGQHELFRVECGCKLAQNASLSRGSFKAGERLRDSFPCPGHFASGPNAREYAVPRMHAIARFAEAVAGC